MFYNDKRHKDGKMSRCKSCHYTFIYRWRERNPDAFKAACRRFHKKYPEKSRAQRAKRHASKLQRTPKWLTKEHLIAIQRFYANCPIGYEVDHIVPLRGKLVNGLHVIWNLRYLNRSDNRKKSNKFI